MDLVLRFFRIIEGNIFRENYNETQTRVFLGCSGFWKNKRKFAAVEMKRQSAPPPSVPDSPGFVATSSRTSSTTGLMLITETTSTSGITHSNKHMNLLFLHLIYMFVTECKLTFFIHFNIKTEFRVDVCLVAVPINSTRCRYKTKLEISRQTDDQDFTSSEVKAEIMVTNNKMIPNNNEPITLVIISFFYQNKVGKNKSVPNKTQSNPQHT